MRRGNRFNSWSGAVGPAGKLPGPRVSNCYDPVVTTIVILGGGQMGEALLSGLMKQPDYRILVVEPSEERRRYLSESYPATPLFANVGGPSEKGESVDAYLIAVKPHALLSVLQRLPERDRDTLIISVAAGVRSATIEAVAPEARVVRVMPNTPALLGAGASAVAAGQSASDADVALAKDLLSSVGTVHIVPEQQLDAVTGLSGSGPAYVFLFAEALIEGAVFEGLSRELATELTAQTLLGAARMIAESGKSPADLRAAVTSPGGTTARGLARLEQGGVRASVADAVSAAAERSREL